MSSAVSRSAQESAWPLERVLAGVLQYGTWLASAIILAGLALAMIHGLFRVPNAVSLPDMRFVTIGIALFILLPVLRVLIMFAAFLRQGDYRFGAIAALVLTIIFLGYILGRHMGSTAER